MFWTGLSIYLLIGSLFGAYEVFETFRMSKEFEETPIEDDDDYEERKKIIDDWERIERQTKSTEGALAALFVACMIAWPYLIYVTIKMRFSKGD
jgi:hypothetical protein